MMQFDRIALGREAKELGFVRDTYEKVCRLVDILAFFERDPLLADALALKGGTAINLTIFSLPRLSVDIDLDLANNLPREEMLAQRRHISEHIKKYMAASGYTLNPRTKEYHALDSYVFEYLNAGGMKDNIKIEINYMMRAHILPLSRRKVNLSWLEKEITVLSVDPMEIFASKIVALMNRAAPRDLYDVYHMQKSNLFDESEKQLLRKCVMLYCAIASENVPDTISFDAVDQMSQNKIKTDLAPVLRRDEFFDLRKNREPVICGLTEFLVPEEKEQRFWDAFKRKEYLPELLFDDPAILSRVSNHPMAVWKCSDRERPSVRAELQNRARIAVDRLGEGQTTKLNPKKKIPER